MKNSLLLSLLVILSMGCQTSQQVTPPALPGVSTNPIPAINQPPLALRLAPQPPPLPPGLTRQSAAQRIRALAVPEPVRTNVVGLATITKLAKGEYQVEFKNWIGPYWISSSDDGFATWHKLGQGDAGTNGLTIIRVVDKENVKMRVYRLHF